MSTKLERQREYHLLRSQVQELREKVEPIKHSRRMSRLIAEKEKLQNFLEHHDDSGQPIKSNLTYTCGSPGGFCYCGDCPAAKRLARFAPINPTKVSHLENFCCEGELCECANYRTSPNSLPIKASTPVTTGFRNWTHPYSEDCDCNFCHPENCECEMCNARRSSCGCLECIQGHGAECTYLSANLPIKTEQPIKDPNHCQCGEFANVFMRDGWCCGKCALARMSPTPINKESVAIVPAVVEPINTTEHLNGECGNSDGCDYCISVG